ncbi:MAG: hypothetical protein MMC23_006459 [Stictis urceolatum]|nr:hypothetical protein [Stictis urceolata]
MDYQPLNLQRNRSRKGLAFCAISVAIILFLLQLASYQDLAAAGSWWSPARSSESVPTYAFATFLTGPSIRTETDDDDVYYVATRLLVYQLLHDPGKRTRNGYPVVVAVTEDVAAHKRDRLTRDGAIVMQVPKIDSDWIHPAPRRWKDMMTKLRIFTFVQYDKILFMDSDMFVTRCIDDIFEDEAAKENENLEQSLGVKSDERLQPSRYVMAGNSGSGGVSHSYPAAKNAFLNGGFFIYKPSMQMFDYYLSVANITERFDPRFAEQSLLNYAHRRDGNMPWKQMHYAWNINWPNWEDYEHGIATLHTKWWDTKSNGDRLMEVIIKGKRDMDEFWAAKARA